MDGPEVPDTAEKKRKLPGQELDDFDPNLDAQDLLASFNERFFWGMLGMVRVKWSYTMTSRAGLCMYQEPGGLCTIILSAPLLSLRPRSDLVEALLHEMIHAYLFLTQNFKDREDHGPEFQKHIHRIKKEGGIKIRIYCPYLSEMSHNRRHVWRCAGPCRGQRPRFGFFMKTANRPPGPSDHWWHTHMRECGGNFEKISPKQKNGKEKSRNEKGKRKKTVAEAKHVRTITRSFGPENPSKPNPSDASSANTAVDESDKSESSKSTEQTETVPDSPNEMEGKPGTSRSGDDFESMPNPSDASSANTAVDDSDKGESSKSTEQIEKVPDSPNEMEGKPGTSRSGDDFESMPNPSDASSANTAVDESDKGESSKSTEKIEEVPDSPNEMEGKPGTSRSGDDFESTPGTSQAGDENLRPTTRRTKKKGLKGKKRKSSDVAEPNASAVDEKRPSVMCPVCAHGFDPESINDHVNACMEEQQFMNEISPDEDNDYGQGPGDYEQYAIPGDYLDEEEEADRVEASLHFFVYNDDIVGDDEPGADKVRCPCCWKWVKEGKINEHIDACLTYNTLRNNPPDSP